MERAGATNLALLLVFVDKRIALEKNLNKLEFEYVKASVSGFWTNAKMQLLSMAKELRKTKDFINENSILRDSLTSSLDGNIRQLQTRLEPLIQYATLRTGSKDVRGALAMIGKTRDLTRDLLEAENQRKFLRETFTDEFMDSIDLAKPAKVSDKIKVFKI